MHVAHETLCQKQMIVSLAEQFSLVLPFFSPRFLKLFVIKVVCETLEGVGLGHAMALSIAGRMLPGLKIWNFESTNLRCILDGIRNPHFHLRNFKVPNGPFFRIEGGFIVRKGKALEDFPPPPEPRITKVFPISGSRNVTLTLNGESFGRPSDPHWITANGIGVKNVTWVSHTEVRLPPMTISEKAWFDGCVLRHVNSVAGAGCGDECGWSGFGALGA